MQSSGQHVFVHNLLQVVFLENGSAEVHVIRKEFSALMPDEIDMFALFLQRTL